MKNMFNVLLFLLFFLNYSITRTFASGWTEKIIMQCLKDLGLPEGKIRLSKTPCPSPEIMSCLNPLAMG